MVCVSVHIVMPMSNYIIVEERGRGLREVVDRIRGSDWLFRQNDSGEEGCGGSQLFCGLIH